MKTSRYILRALERFAFILAIIIVVRFLFEGEFIIQLRDIFLTIIITVVFLVQTHLAKRKQEEIDKRAEADRKKQAW